MFAQVHRSNKKAQAFFYLHSIDFQKILVSLLTANCFNYCMTLFHFSIKILLFLLLLLFYFHLQALPQLFPSVTCYPPHAFHAN